MTPKRKVEVFTAGCELCDTAVELVKQVACASCEVSVMSMQDESAASKAKGYGVPAVPAVVVDGKLLDCCKGELSEAALRETGIGAEG